MQSAQSEPLPTRRPSPAPRRFPQDDVAGMLQYAFTVAMSLIQNRQFRNTVLRALIELYRNLATPDYVNMCQCLIFLDDASAVAQVLEKLIRGTQVPNVIRVAGMCQCVCSKWRLTGRPQGVTQSW